jgi:hypothetical protein
VLKFWDADVQPLLTAYAFLTGREYVASDTQVFPFKFRKFSVKSQTSLDQAEAIYLLEALAYVNGLAIETL